jgi:hypothetical protein
MLSPDKSSQQRQPGPSPAALFFELLSIYLLFVIARFAISLFISNPLVPTDEIAYKNFAYSFFRTGHFYRTENLGYSIYLPNVLYSFLISPSFFLGEQFYIGIKLINSLLINVSFFPAYSLAREFITHKKALLTATSVLLLPSFHSVSFVAVDGLNITLFLFSFLFCYRSLTRGGLNGPLAGLFMALMLLNKPTAFAYLAGFVLANIMFVLYGVKVKDAVQFKTVLRSFTGAAVSLIGLLVILSFLLKGEVSYHLGIYGRQLGVTSAHIPISEAADMAIAYPFVLAATGYIFLFVCCAALVDILLRKQTAFEYRHAVLLILAFATTVAYWAEVSKFMVDIYSDEHFDKLHTRYLFMICPLFLISFSVLVERIKWYPSHSGLLFIFFGAVLFLDITHFFPKYVVSGLNIFGSPDIGWAIASANLLLPISCLSTVGVFLFYIFRKRRSAAPYLICFIPLMVLANYGEIRNHIRLDAGNSANANYRYFVQGVITDTNASIAVIDEWLGHRLWLAFWLPYDYTAAYDLPKGSVITRQMIPLRTRYLVVFGDYQVEVPTSLIGRSGKCSLLAVAP